ncbi:MAG: ACT domain-containing protein [Planctomycetota bacterium]
MSTVSGPLQQLLAALQPEWEDRDYIFARVPADHPIPAEAFATVRETEGTTLILDAEIAHREGLPESTLFRKITLGVDSSLEAVGLTAAVAAALVRIDCPANVVAGYGHDHLFVPADRAREALATLQQLSCTAAEQLKS